MIEYGVSLKPYNSFGLDAKSAAFANIRSVAQLRQILATWDGSTPFILGGGSNMLLRGDVDRLVLKNDICGKKYTLTPDGHAVVVAGGGENWHDFVLWTLENGLGGLENLSLIPGTVGASPIQNIGAYGVELRDIFLGLSAVDMHTGEVHRFKSADCQFGYRNSRFKQDWKGQFFITHVAFRLTTQNHRINTSYGAIQQSLTEMAVETPTPSDVSRAVIGIRSSKLPDPAVLGNSGSFFKNPVLTAEQFAALQQQYPNIPHYPQGDGRIKVPAGWLIEQAGWKGRREGDAGTYEKQALVLVNHGAATGDELWAFAQQIITAVEQQFGVRLEPEVNVI